LPLFHSSGVVIFNFVPVGSTSEAKSATISNAGEGALEITGAEISAASQKNFSIVSDGCIGISLGAGQSCTVSLAFHPSAADTEVGALVIADARDVCANYIALAGSGTETEAPTTAKSADCIVPGPTITLPGKVITAPAKVVTVPGKTVTIKAPVRPPSTTPGSDVDLLQFVSPPRCVSGRHISLHLRTSKAERIVLARAHVNGRLAGGAHGHSVSVVTAGLRGKPVDRYLVRVVASIASGKTLSSTHYFVSCAAPALKQSSKPH
jgi:hypothetical protein